MNDTPEIFFHIKAKTIGELRQILSAMLTESNPTLIVADAPSVISRTASEVIADSEPDTDPPKKERKKRRTKAEMAAAKVAEAAADDAVESDSGPTLADVEAAMRDLYSAGEGGGDAMVDILEKVGAVNDAKETKVNMVPPEKFAETIDMARKAAASMGADSANSAHGAFD